MSDSHLRQLTADDLADALVLSSTAGWNQRIDDWRMLLSLAPHGCFAAWSGDRVVGTAIGIDYGGFGWIAMMLVDPAWRGRGLGRRLLEAAVAAIAPDRVIRLDATPLGRPLYQSYGFQDEARLTRLVAPAGAREAAETAGEADSVAAAARPLTMADMPAVAGVDRDVFGGHRRPLLEWALKAAPASGWMVPGNGAVPQYCLGRRGRLFDQIGPVVAYDDRAARALVSAARRAASDRSLVVDAAEAYPAFTGWLRTRGFADERPLFRMRLERTPAAPASPSGSVPTEFAILGPEFG